MIEERHAILIASSRFPKERKLAPLRCPENDVEGLNKLLSRKGHGDYQHVAPLKNRPHYEVLRTVNIALKRATKGNVVLIYYSGHGKLDRAGRLYLATSNTEVEALESTSIPVTTLLDYIRLSSCKNVGLILDCCYSGAVGESILRGSVEEQLQSASRSAGVYILTASTGVQAAEEKETDEYGLLTKYIIRGIESGEADLKEDGNISMDELYEYVHRKVTEEGFQEPMKWGLNITGELIIARSGKPPNRKTPPDMRHEEMRRMMLDYATEGHSDRLVLHFVDLLKRIPGWRTRRRQLQHLFDEQLPPGDVVQQRSVATLGHKVRGQQKTALAKLPGTQQPVAPHAGAMKTNSIDGQKYVWILPGQFQMGCSDDWNECDNDERPAHQVRITNGFWLGQTAVTQAAYQKVMGSNPSLFKGPQLPVENVTWNEGLQYCEAVGGRLPTEAEWEYAARAGNTSSRYEELDAIAWYDGNSCSRTHPVQRKRPNSWGLYDMLGNVWEWVADAYEESHYTAEPSLTADTKGPSGAKRVLRGGSWCAHSRSIRASHRGYRSPDERGNDIGFRCALV